LNIVININHLAELSFNSLYLVYYIFSELEHLRCGISGRNFNIRGRGGHLEKSRKCGCWSYKNWWHV